jgi:L-fuconolactonase
VRVDAHQHFWRYDPMQYGWIGDRMDVLRRDYMPEQLEPLLQAAGVDGTIAVQARQTLEETEFLLGLADEHAFVKGVVGWVDLCSPSLDAQLARYSGRPKLLGVRHLVHDEPDDDFMLRPAFQHGIGRLREHGLTYDLLLFPRHLPRAVRLVEAFPEQPFVLDHIAKPLIRDRVVSPWREHLRQLAAFPNVSCKVSGMVTEADWQQWRADDIRPYLDIVLESFGASRLMIGSDWPVCTLAADYAATMAVVIDFVQRLSDDEQAAILGGTAARVYGLGARS